MSRTKTVIIPKGCVGANETIIIEIPSHLKNHTTVMARRKTPLGTLKATCGEGGGSCKHADEGTCSCSEPSVPPPAEQLETTYGYNPDISSAGQSSVYSPWIKRKHKPDIEFEPPFASTFIELPADPVPQSIPPPVSYYGRHEETYGGYPANFRPYRYPDHVSMGDNLSPISMYRTAQDITPMDGYEEDSSDMYVSSSGEMDTSLLGQVVGGEIARRLSWPSVYGKQAPAGLGSNVTFNAAPGNETFNFNHSRSLTENSANTTTSTSRQPNQTYSTGEIQTTYNSSTGSIEKSYTEEVSEMYDPSDDSLLENLLSGAIGRRVEHPASLYLNGTNENPNKTRLKSVKFKTKSSPALGAYTEELTQTYETGESGLGFSSVSPDQTFSITPASASFTPPASSPPRQSLDQTYSVAPIREISSLIRSRSPTRTKIKRTTFTYPQVDDRNRMPTLDSSYEEGRDLDMSVQDQELDNLEASEIALVQQDLKDWQEARRRLIFDATQIMAVGAMKASKKCGCCSCAH